jgi:hypothetical protein
VEPGDLDLLELMTVEHRRAVESSDPEAARERFVRRFAFSVPTPEAVDAIAARSPDGVVEVGAGTGAWARVLTAAGVPVAAFDVAPAPSAENQWFAGSPAWHPVVRGDHRIAADHPGRTLLVVWPPQGEIWPTEVLELFHAAGGGTVAYVGEGPGGRTAEETFHRRLGELEECLQCVHGVRDVPCICGIDPLWRRTVAVELPSWGRGTDALRIYERASTPPV